MASICCGRKADRPQVTAPDKFSALEERSGLVSKGGRVGRRGDDGVYTFAAGDVGVYSVCPQSWKLKVLDQADDVPSTDAAVRGQRLHKIWSVLLEESLLLSRWIRYLVTMLCLVMAVFMFVNQGEHGWQKITQLSWRNPVFQLAALVVALGVLIRSFRKAETKRLTESGFAQGERPISVEGSTILPGREYVSTQQRLAGKPDALLLENGVVIPVEMKPLAKKLRDRYVAQLLVYMRLVEEFEGARPPHGYLFLGPRYRRIKIENSAAKQRWVDQMLSEMHSVVQGASAGATPHPAKCARCDVRHRCRFRADEGGDGAEGA